MLLVVAVMISQVTYYRVEWKNNTISESQVANNSLNNNGCMLIIKLVILPNTETSLPARIISTYAVRHNMKNPSKTTFFSNEQSNAKLKFRIEKKIANLWFAVDTYYYFKLISQYQDYYPVLLYSSAT